MPKHFLFLFSSLWVLAALAPPTSAASGQLLWTFEAQGAIWGDLTAEGDSVYFGSDDGHLYALDARKQSQRWRFKTGDKVRSTPVIAAEAIFFSSDDGYLYGLNRATGRLLWKFDLGDGDLLRSGPANRPNAQYDWGSSSPAHAGNALFVGSGTGNVFAVDPATGRELWRFQAEGRVRGRPAFDNRHVFVGSWSGHFYALDRHTGKPVWEQKTGGPILSSPLVVGGKVVVGSRDANLYAWHADTGKPVWVFTHDSGSWVESSAVAAQDGSAVFVGSSDAQRLFKLDAITGRELWAFDTGGWSWGTPALVEGVVYIGALGVTGHWQPVEGGFFAVDAATGEQRWSFGTAELPGFITGGVHAAAAVWRDRVYLGALDGVVYVLQK